MTNTRSNAYYINEVIDSGILASVSPSHGQVYIAYVRYSNGGVKDAFPSQEKLSDNLGMDVRTIRRAIKELGRLGYIKQVSSGKGKGSKKSNLFTVMMPSQLGFPKKSATQAPVPLAPVPTSTNQPNPQPAPAAAPAQSSTDPMKVNAPHSSLKTPYVIKHKTEEGVTTIEAFDLAKKKGHPRVSKIDEAQSLDEYFSIMSNLDNEVGNDLLEKFWREVQAM